MRRMQKRPAPSEMRRVQMRTVEMRRVQKRTVKRRNVQIRTAEVSTCMVKILAPSLSLLRALGVKCMQLVYSACVSHATRSIVEQ